MVEKADTSSINPRQLQLGDKKSFYHINRKFQVKLCEGHRFPFVGNSVNIFVSFLRLLKINVSPVNLIFLALI